MRDKSNVEVKIENPENKKITLICHSCSKNTNQEILSSVAIDGVQDCGNGNYYSWWNKYQIIKCCGCDSITFRETEQNSEDFEYYDNNEQELLTTTNLYPKNKDVTVFEEFYHLPTVIQAIYHETVTAINSNLPILAAIGIRAILDAICKEKKTEDSIKLKNKSIPEKKLQIPFNLKSYVTELECLGIISKQNLEVLQKLRLLGNESAHEARAHEISQLFLAMKIISKLLWDTYILENYNEQLTIKKINNRITLDGL